MTVATAARDVFVTGMGMVTPNGLDLSSTWRSLLRGTSGVTRIRAFDPSPFPTQIAGQVPITVDDYESRLLGRPSRNRKEHFALRALDEALCSAGLSPTDLRGERTGLFTASEQAPRADFSMLASYATVSASEFEELRRKHHRDLIERQPDSLACALRAEAISDLRLVFNYAMACAAGAVAVHEAARWIRRGVIDRAIVIAIDTPVHVGSIIGFGLLDALSTYNDEPAKASRPFDARRDGFVLAEGAGALILEAPRFALARGAKVLGRLMGIGMSNNEAHITNTPPSGERAASAIESAVADAGLRPEQIGYINAHGTSTNVGDISESAAIQRVFAQPPPVSSTKSMTGHLIAAAGLVEAIITLQAMRHGQLPPTINYEQPDPECPLDYVPNVARVCPVQYGLSNSFGFGGTNVALVFGKAPA